MAKLEKPPKPEKLTPELERIRDEDRKRYRDNVVQALRDGKPGAFIKLVTQRAAVEAAHRLRECYAPNRVPQPTKREGSPALLALKPDGLPADWDAEKRFTAMSAASLYDNTALLLWTLNELRARPGTVDRVAHLGHCIAAYAFQLGCSLMGCSNYADRVALANMRAAGEDARAAKKTQTAQRDAELVRLVKADLKQQSKTRKRSSKAEAFRRVAAETDKSEATIKRAWKRSQK